MQLPYQTLSKENNLSDKNVDFHFTPTPRINGFIYLKDYKDEIVRINGKVKKFKTTTACAKWLYEVKAGAIKLEEV